MYHDKYLVIMIMYRFVNQIFSCCIVCSADDVPLDGMLVDFARYLHTCLVMCIVGILVTVQDFISSYIDRLPASQEVIYFFGGEFVWFLYHSYAMIKDIEIINLISFLFFLLP